MLADTLELNVVHLLMDYCVLARAVMEMHARTGHVIAQATQAEAAAKKAQLAGPSKAARAEELAGNAGRLRDTADQAEANNKESVAELQTQRISDFKQAMIVYAVNNMEAAAAEMQLWQGALNSLRDLREELLLEPDAEAEEAGDEAAGECDGESEAGRADAASAPPDAEHGSLMSF
jgi:hypothetical protein